MVFDIIYDTLEHSCNVLNYTKLNELVANKKHQNDLITGMCLAESVYISSLKGKVFLLYISGSYINDNNGHSHQIAQ